MGIFKKSGNWGIDFYVNGRRKRKIIGSSKALAEKVLKKIQVEIIEGKYLNVRRNNRIKFDEAVAEYTGKHLKLNCSKGWANMSKYIVKQLRLSFGGKYLDEIDSMMIEDYKTERVKEVSSSTVNNDLAFLKAMFNKIKSWGRFEGENPVSKVQLLKEDNKRTRYLEKEQIAILVENCAEYLKPIVIMALNTGMRKNEILKLRWEDVNLRRGVIQLLKTKNNKVRYVPINKAVRNMLINIARKDGNCYVFTNRKGRPFVDIKKSFKAALSKSGITEFRFHDLRHTFASQLAMNGVDLNTVRELLGHTSLQMTLRYAHLSLDHKKNAVYLLEEGIKDSDLLGVTLV